VEGGVHGSQKDSTNVVNLGREEASGDLICIIIFFHLVSTLGEPKTERLLSRGCAFPSPHAPPSSLALARSRSSLILARSCASLVQV